MARRLKGKIVLIGQVDYQVKNAGLLVRELRKRGYSCVILDNSEIADQGRRQYRGEDETLLWRTEYIRVKCAPYGADWLSTASLVVAFNDFNPTFREALEYRHRLELPTVCMVEGINDFLRIDFYTPRALPYRRCDYVFLAGEDDEQYFADRPTFVVGMPNIETLAKLQPRFPSEMRAVLNVNFTYGALEDKRDGFIRAAQKAFDSRAIRWEITQHPMDNGDLTSLPVSALSQQELFDRCSVFVSRFATAIIEALASGKPVIYFNPHGEQVAKFAEPPGAFEIARSPADLVQAIGRIEEDIAAGVDFRARASRFLQRHAAFGLPDGSDVGSRFAVAVGSVLEAGRASVGARSALFLERLDALVPFRQQRPGLVLGDFTRIHGAQLNEEEIIGRWFGSHKGLMIDVGANFGNSLDVYLGKGWSVHAFEPDPNNRARLELLWPDYRQLVINPEAVTASDGMMLPLYASDESTGISGLSAFTDGHRQVTEVSTVTLATYMETSGIEHVDFLKVDVEGFDKFVLDGFPWENDHPDAILVEFDDFKTVPLGYAVGDIVEILERHGYSVYVSEWHPVVRYGIAHDWKCLSRYDPAVDLSDAWGNIVAFLNDPGEEVLASAAVETVRFVVRTPDTTRATSHAAATAATSATRPIAVTSRYSLGALLQRLSPRLHRMVRRWRLAWAARGSQSRGWLYREFANGVREGMPSVFRAAQCFAWALRAARRIELQRHRSSWH